MKQRIHVEQPIVIQTHASIMHASSVSLCQDWSTKYMQKLQGKHTSGEIRAHLTEDVALWHQKITR